MTKIGLSNISLSLPSERERSIVCVFTQSLKQSLQCKLSRSDTRVADLARVYDSYHSLYAKRGDYKRAFYYLRKSLRLYYTTFGQKNLPYAKALIAVADLYQQQDKLPQAIKLWRKANSIVKQIVSAKHPVSKLLKTRLMLVGEAESS
jgi:tetratricopeptide (TPR) repeat protein